MHLIKKEKKNYIHSTLSTIPINPFTSNSSYHAKFSNWFLAVWNLEQNKIARFFFWISNLIHLKGTLFYLKTVNQFINSFCFVEFIFLFFSEIDGFIHFSVFLCDWNRITMGKHPGNWWKRYDNCNDWKFITYFDWWTNCKLFKYCKVKKNEKKKKLKRIFF